jgi:hypothetical protein
VAVCVAVVMPFYVVAVCVAFCCGIILFCFACISVCYLHVINTESPACVNFGIYTNCYLKPHFTICIENENVVLI